jgi:hypothetical protein
MKVYWVSRSISPRILDVCTGWSVQLHPKGRSPCYPLDRRLGGPQSRSGRGGVEKNSHPLSGFEPPIIQLVAHPYTTELSRLLTKGHLRQGSMVYT